MNTTIKIQPRYLIDLINYYLIDLVNCEMGAHEDGLTGPSPLTTVTILERHPNQIELRSIEEAVQVYDALLYGTFPLEHPTVADRLATEIGRVEGVREAWLKHDQGQWAELANQLDGIVKDTAIEPPTS